MIKEHFYFLTDDYCERYEQYRIMKNKEVSDGTIKNRPCFYAIQDEDDDNIYWMIPISSQIEKFQRLLAEKLLRYPDYDGLEFGYVKGRQAAFLIQNICPVTINDIVEEYVDENTNQAVIINSNTIKTAVINKARKVINLTKRGIRATQTDAYAIYQDIKLRQANQE